MEPNEEEEEVDWLAWYRGSPSTDELKKELLFATPDKENPKSIWVEKKTTGSGEQKVESGGKREESDAEIVEGCVSEVPEPLRPNEGRVSYIEDTKPEDKSEKGEEAVKPENLKGGFDEDALKGDSESEYDEDEVAEVSSDDQQIEDEENVMRGDYVNSTEETTGGIGSVERVSAQNGDKVLGDNYVDMRDGVGSEDKKEVGKLGHDVNCVSLGLDTVDSLDDDILGEGHRSTACAQKVFDSMSKPKSWASLLARRSSGSSLSFIEPSESDESFGHGSEECSFNKPAKIQEDILQEGGCENESEGKRVEVDPFGEQGEWTVVGKRKVLGQDKKALGPNRVKRHEGGEFQGVKQGNSQTYRGRFVHQPVTRHRASSHRCSVVDHPILQPGPSVPPRRLAALACCPVPLPLYPA
ncbi:hypothetical protein U1Q18_032787 [Sarracenia purpurea var. burkii]